MLTIPGYTVHKLLGSSARTKLYASTRDRDGRPVVLQVSAAGTAERVRAEFDLLRRVAGPGIIEALDLELTDEQPVLVLAPPCGVPLESLVHAPVETREFVRIAEAVGAALARVHDAHIVHCDLCPDTLYFDSESGEAQIVSLRLAAELGAVPRSGEREPASSPACIAPEQAGLVRAGIDFRTDLYSLGATLSQLLPRELARKQPVSRADGARASEPAHREAGSGSEIGPGSEIERGSEIESGSEILTRIVEKLRHEQPDDRYQTLGMFRADIAECRRRFDATGWIEEFPLARSDAPDRLYFPRALIDRDEQVTALREVFERVSTTRRCEAVWIRGPSGVGKTSLVDALRTATATREHYLAWGKFDLYRQDVPYAGVQAALDSIVQQWLTEDDERLTAWRDRLIDHMGSLMPALAEWIPDLRFVLGSAPKSAPRLGSREFRNRLTVAAARFLRCVAEAAPPLVLLLDDLQWADAGSLAMLETLCGELRFAPVLVIATERSHLSASYASDSSHASDTSHASDGETSEPDASRFTSSDSDASSVRLLRRLEAARLSILRVELEPLSPDAVCELLSRALECEPERLGELATRIWEKTGGIPLLIPQFMGHLKHLGHLWFEVHSGWRWNEAAVAATHIPDGAVGLMLAKLERLPPALRRLLSLASCLADQFSVELLRDRTSLEVEELERGLWELCDEGMIIPCLRGYTFAHDRIREVAQRLLSEEERQRVHARAVSCLLERAAPEELASSILEIADHLQRAEERLDPEIAERRVELNLRASAYALANGAPETALRHARAAHALLDEAIWEECPSQAFDVSMQYVECAFQTQHFELARELLEGLEARPLTPVQEARAIGRRISVDFSQGGDRKEILRTVLAALARFGLVWPANPSRLRELWEYLRTDWMLRGPLTLDSFRPADASDTSWLPPVLVLVVATPVLVYVHPQLLRIITAYCLRAYKRHGYRDSPALVLAGYAACRRGLIGDTQRSQRYARAAEEWSRALPRELSSVRAEHSLYAAFYPWTRPRRELQPRCRELIDETLAMGDLEMALSATRHYALVSALIGDPLEDVAERFLAADTMGLVSGRGHAKLALELLRGRSETDAAVDPRGAEALRVPEHRSAPWLAAALCISGHHQVLIEEALATAPHVILPRGKPTASFDLDYLFFIGVSCAELATRGHAPRRCRRQLRESTRLLRAAAARGRDFEHMYRALSAEQARVAGQYERASKRYTLAAQLSVKDGYAHHAAFLCERHARMLQVRQRQTDSDALLRRALLLYAEWGAHAKVREVRGLLGEPEPATS